MKKTPATDFDVLIIGAGAAGLAAAESARHRCLSYVLVEAAGRIGGRAQTELLLPGCPIDLGCHYLHSTDVNPFTDIARHFGFTLQTRPRVRHYYRGAQPLTAAEQDGYERYRRQCEEAFARAAQQKRDVALADLIDRQSPFAPFYRYYLSLLHSKDPTDVSVLDAVLYDNSGEDWLIKEGFGALIMRYGHGIPVSLSCPVTAIAWDGQGICAHTAKGDIRAAAAIITVSTGALADIKFTPPLPPAKQSALAALPMGNYKHFYGELSDAALTDNEDGFDALQFADGAELFFHIRPFGLPYLEAAVAGAAANTLDDMSEAAQRDFFVTACRHTFGAGIAKKLGRFVVTRWRQNRWVRGGYAAAKPGHGNSRFELARPLAEKLYFAGEAASSDAYNSAHGAYLSGQRAVAEFVADRSGATEKSV